MSHDTPSLAIISGFEPDLASPSAEPITDDEILSTLGEPIPTPPYQPPSTPVAPTPVDPIEYQRRQGKPINVESSVIWAQLFSIFGAIACVAIGLSLLIERRSARAFPLVPILIATLGPLAFRVLCDFFVATLRIYERLTEIRDALDDEDA